jgi:hypothetical protein
LRIAARSGGEHRRRAAEISKFDGVITVVLPPPTLPFSTKKPSIGD